MIGRKSEQGELARMYESDESEFVAIYGRRRVGKTYLVRETFDGQFTFQHSGLAKGGMKRQLANFAVSLKSFGLSGHGTPKNWDEAFVMLREVIDASEFRRKVVFIDEMPWLDTPRSNFVSALEGFWNGWASARKDILLIVCGSAASWIAKKLFRNRGGLHNRVTCRICLNPFTLNECESLVRERGLVMSRAEIAECYMAFGGIPFYWRYLDKRFSVAQNLDRMFFADGAPLADEFVELYSSLFRNSAMPRKIVKELAGRLVGMTRKDIAHALGISASGKLTDALEALTVSGFVRKYNPFGSGVSKQVFQLVDAFSLFHFRYLAGRRSSDGNFWLRTVDSPSHRVWCGLAFERLCLLHQPQIRKALGIVGVLSECCAWHHRADDMCPDGAQIDLLFDRADNVINICECKYTAEPFRIDKEYDAKLAQKVGVFREVTKTRKSIHLTLITSSGLIRNEYSSRVQSEVTLDDLFAAEP